MTNQLENENQYHNEPTIVFFHIPRIIFIQKFNLKI
jgi:hypothetical protein